EGWAKVSKVLREYDDDVIKGYKEDMDTLLVFAGLFSAVLTAFLIEVYKSLQQDPTVVSTQVLLHISEQLAGLSNTNGVSFNGSIPAATSPNFTRMPLTVKVNTLWFLSLVFSLITASLSIMVKQWLREYLTHDSLSPRAHVRIRHFRNDGLYTFRVFQIAAILPLLLQISLLLFFLGLGLFLHDLDSVIGWVVVPFLIAWIVLVYIAMSAPFFAAACPYKLP
ncbi:hypothetical protein C8Q75DRAFT_696139, partial [Abortiporus biennis]